MDRRELFGVFGSLGVGLSCCSHPAQADHGKDDKSMMGSMAALTGFHLHFCGIHVAKKDPKFQLIAHHVCGPLGNMHQCLLFDSTAKNAKLLGVEYIIPDEMFRQLPDTEKKYWHPHTYEVLAGGLTAPGMKADDEMKFMKAILTTWGKTWHTWPDPTTPVPMGEPLLMWAVTGDGQIDEKVLATRDKMYGIDTPKLRETRCKEIGFEVPQVAAPKSIDFIGRQWTNQGEDKPTAKK